MKKVPTLFVRDPNDRKHVLPEVTSGCEWVLSGEGVPTRKLDGTCVMFDGDRWWFRREVKPGKAEPVGWVEVDADPVTGKRMGWEPAANSSFLPVLAEAIDRRPGYWTPRTYELIGPKINGNPERFDNHALIGHGASVLFGAEEPPRTFEGLRSWLLSHDYEGIVWHHPDGRMVKLKKRDFA